MDKKARQLGMNPSTASNRLVKDVLFSLIVKSGQNKCHQCGNEMCREDFSIEHKTPWLDSENPLELYFDLDNISFSHRNCNVDARRKTYAPCGTVTKYNNGCRCDECKEAKSLKYTNGYSKEKRSDRYQRTGN